MKLTKKEKFEEAENKISKLKSESYTEIIDQNLPIVEISDMDIAEKAEIDDNNKRFIN
jgi:hypothetical protein